MAEGKRLYFADLLRIIATLGVGMVHVASYYWYSADIAGGDFAALSTGAGIGRFSVPLFVMLSGMTFLDPARTVDWPYIRKKLLRLAAAFCFWSAVYTAFAVYTGSVAATAGAVLQKFILGPDHLWFLYMLAGLYVCAPFLRAVAADRGLARAFILLFAALTLVLPILQWIPGLSFTYKVYTKINVGVVAGYTGHFVAGWYFMNNTPKKPWRAALYIAGAVCAVSECVLTVVCSRAGGAAVAWPLNSLTILSGLPAWAIFVLFRQLFEKRSVSPRAGRVLGYVSSLTFGIYLIHELFNAIFRTLGLSAFSMPLWLGIPVMTALVFVCSAVVTAALKKLPLLNKLV